MVLPDEAPAGSERASLGRRALLVVAAVALGAGALLMGALTSPDTEAAADTSTTTTTTPIVDVDRPIDWENFTVDQIAVGEPLEWRRVVGVEGGWNTTLVSQLGILYMFTTTALPDGSSQSLRVYRSFDGWRWEDLGEVFSSDGQLLGVAATPLGLMAVESNPSDGSLTSWVSTDAIGWEYGPIGRAESPLTSFDSQSIGANDSLIVVAGVSYQDGAPLLEQRLHEYGIDVDLRSMGWSVLPTGTDSAIVLYGPLGIPAMSITASEIGLTNEEQQLLQGIGIGTPDAMTWSTSDGSTWVPSTIERVGWISSITPSPDGSILAFGSGNAGNAVWRTYDGVTWEELPYGLRVETAQPWRGRLVGLSYSGTPEVLISPTGETWTELGLDGYFPHRLNWYATGLATGVSGLAVTVEGSRPGTSGGRSEPDPVTLERGGFTLTLDLDQGQIHLDDGDTVRSWAVWNSIHPSQDMVVDLAGETITFLDASGAELVTFTFDEIEQAENDYWMSNYATEEQFSALAVSRDGSTWSVQDLDTPFGKTAQVVDLAITVDTLVAVVVPSPQGFFDGGELQIWSAPLP